MKKELISRSHEETMAIGEELGTHAAAGAVYALIGGLGCGKTVLAKGIARGLGVTEEITSPSFTMLEIYEGGRFPFYHFDLYRIADPKELDRLSFEEYWDGDGVSVIEWADRAEDRLPPSRVRITFERLDEQGRRIIIEYPRD